MTNIGHSLKGHSLLESKSVHGVNLASPKRKFLHSLYERVSECKTRISNSSLSRKYTKKHLLTMIILLALFIGLGFAGYKLLTEIRIHVTDIEVTNITDSSATIVFRTNWSTKAQVWISDKEDINFATAYFAKSNNYDDRDMEENENGDFILKETGRQKRKLHTVTIRNLEPEKTYYVWTGDSLIPHKAKFESSGQEAFTTYSTIDALATPDPAYSTVWDSSGTGLQDVLIFAYLYQNGENRQEENKSTYLSTTTNSNGGWALDMNTFRNQEGGKYDIIPNLTQIRITTEDENALRFSNFFPLIDYQPLPIIRFGAIYQQSSNASYLGANYDERFAKSLIQDIIPDVYSFTLTELAPAPIEPNPLSPSTNISSTTGCHGTCRPLNVLDNPSSYYTGWYANGSGNCCGLHETTQYICINNQWTVKENSPSCQLASSSNAICTIQNCTPLNNPNTPKGNYTYGESCCGYGSYKYTCAENGEWAVSYSPDCSSTTKGKCFGTCRNPYDPSGTFKTDWYNPSYSSCCGMDNRQYICMGDGNWASQENPGLCGTATNQTTSVQLVSPNLSTIQATTIQNSMTVSWNKLSDQDYQILKDNGKDLSIRFILDGNQHMYVPFQDGKATLTQITTLSYIDWRLYENTTPADQSTIVSCTPNSGSIQNENEQFLPISCSVTPPPEDQMKVSWNKLSDSDYQFLRDNNKDLNMRFILQGGKYEYIPFQDGTATLTGLDDYVDWAIFENADIVDRSDLVSCNFSSGTILVASEQTLPIVCTVNRTKQTTATQQMTLDIIWDPMDNNSAQKAQQHGYNIDLLFQFSQIGENIGYELGMFKKEYPQTVLENQWINWFVVVNGEIVDINTVNTKFPELYCNNYKGSIYIDSALQRKIAPYCYVMSLTQPQPTTPSTVTLDLIWEVMDPPSLELGKDLGVDLGIQFQNDQWNKMVEYEQGKLYEEFVQGQLQNQTVNWQITANGYPVESSQIPDRYPGLACISYDGSFVIDSGKTQKIFPNCDFENVMKKVTWTIDSIGDTQIDLNGSELELIVSLSNDSGKEENVSTHLIATNERQYSFPILDFKNITLSATFIRNNSNTNCTFDGPQTISFSRSQSGEFYLQCAVEGCQDVSKTCSYLDKAHSLREMMASPGYCYSKDNTCLQCNNSAWDKKPDWECYPYLDPGHDCENKSCGEGWCILGDDPYDGKWGCVCDNGTQTEINSSPSICTSKEKDLIIPVVPAKGDIELFQIFTDMITKVKIDLNRSLKTSPRIILINCEDDPSNTVCQGTYICQHVEQIGSVVCDKTKIEEMCKDPGMCSKIFMHEIIHFYQDETQLGLSKASSEACVRSRVWKEVGAEAYSDTQGFVFFVNNTYYNASEYISMLKERNQEITYENIYNVLTGKDLETAETMFFTTKFTDPKTQKESTLCEIIKDTNLYIRIQENQISSKLQKDLISGVSADSVTEETGELISIPSEFDTTELSEDVIEAETIESGAYSLPQLEEQTKSLVLPEFETSTPVQLYVDVNNDGTKQEEEPFIVDKSLALNKISSSFSYSFSQGWNLISFPFLSDDFSDAQNFLKILEQQGLQPVSIASYENGTWKLFSFQYGSDAQTYSFGNNFNITPGKGYFIRVGTKGNVTFTGNGFESSVPIELHNGWNLIGIHSPNSYTANSLIDTCLDKEVICDTVSSYDSGRYVNVVKIDSLLYGNDYNIIKKDGYFLRVKSGGGNHSVTF